MIILLRFRIEDSRISGAWTIANKVIFPIDGQKQYCETADLMTTFRIGTKEVIWSAFGRIFHDNYRIRAVF